MIIITGASGGIGQAIIPLLKDKVLPIYNKKEIKDGWHLDLTDLKLIKEFAEQQSGSITLIHLAAIKKDELAVFVNEKNWDDVFNVNVKGAFFLTKELLNVMMKERWGRIIWVISSGLGDVGSASYSASKFALLGLSEVISKEYARFGITSNVLQLGYFKTGLWEKLTEEKQEELLNQIPSKKLGDVQSIVNAIEMIINSPFVNGAVVNIDGGV